MPLISIAKFIENAAEIGILCTNLIIMQCAVQNSKVYPITGTLKHFVNLTAFQAYSMDWKRNALFQYWINILLG